jgi:GntR family transcriptional regulator
MPILDRWMLGHFPGANPTSIAEFRVSQQVNWRFRALSSGDQLPGIRSLAETLVINPNTVIKVYRELEQEGVLEIRHGLGAFVIARRRRRPKTEEMRDAQQQVRDFVETLKQQGLDEGKIRRLFEAELAGEFQRR